MDFSIAYLAPGWTKLTRGKTTWADPRRHSWYKNDSGHITQNWSANVRDFGTLAESVAWKDYDLK